MKSEMATREGFIKEVKEAELVLVGVTPIFAYKEVQNIGIKTQVSLALSGVSENEYYVYHTEMIGEAYEDTMPALLEKLEAERERALNQLKELNPGKLRIIDGRVLP